MNTTIDLTHLNTFTCVNLKVVCKVTSLLEGGPYWGSALHGVLGQSLKQLHCTAADGVCETCKNTADCTFVEAFKTPAPAGYEHSSKYAEPPQPFIIRKDVFDKSVFLPGDSFSFELTLIGNAIRLLPVYLEGFAQVGKTGMGKRRGTFEIVEILTNKKGDGKFVKAQGKNLLKPVDVSSFFDYPAPIEKVELHFVTPLHIKEKGEPVVVPQPALFIERLYERVSLLNHLYCRGAMQPLPKTDLSNWTTNAEMTTMPFARFSTRHNQKIPLWGSIGKLTWNGNITPMMPLLKMGQLVNIGKMAALGLGQYRLVYG